MNGGVSHSDRRNQKYTEEPMEAGKDSLLLETLGTLDELNAHLGLARSAGLPEEMNQLLGRIQGELLQMGMELAARMTGAKPTPIRPDQVQALYQEAARWEADLPRLQRFIIPGGSPAACQLHVCRAVCRRAERRLSSLFSSSPQGAVSLVLKDYLNQLGKLLFVLARSANQQAGIQETPWQGPPASDGAP